MAPVHALHARACACARTHLVACAPQPPRALALTAIQHAHSSLQAAGGAAGVSGGGRVGARPADSAGHGRQAREYVGALLVGQAARAAGGGGHFIASQQQQCSLMPQCWRGEHKNNGVVICSLALVAPLTPTPHPLTPFAAPALHFPAPAASQRRQRGVLAQPGQGGVAAEPGRGDEGVAQALVCAQAGLPLPLHEPRCVGWVGGGGEGFGRSI